MRQHVPDTPIYLGDDRKTTSTWAWHAGRRQVSDLVADERHCKIVQRRYHDAPEFAGFARHSAIVEDFHEHALGLHVIVLVPGTLQGDVTELARRINIGDRHAPG